MNNWFYYTVPKIFIVLYVRNMLTNFGIFTFIGIMFFGVLPGSSSMFILWLMTDISFYHAMKRFKDDDS
jgi:hypothetical protein